MDDKLLYRDEVYAIQGAVFDVYKTMGNMWGEEMYRKDNSGTQGGGRIG